MYIIHLGFVYCNLFSTNKTAFENFKVEVDVNPKKVLKHARLPALEMINKLNLIF